MRLLDMRCLKIECRDARRDKKFTRHTGSVIDIRDFTPLFIRVEDGPSTSATRKVLALEIRKARLRGSAGESIWGSPQSLDNVPELKEWLHELRKPDGNRYAHSALCPTLAWLTSYHQRRTKDQEEAAR